MTLTHNDSVTEPPEATPPSSNLDQEKVMVVIPAFNEEGTIGEVVNDVRAILATAGIPFEIVVVDDGSSDRTAEEALRAGVNVIRHMKTLGQGVALKTGIAAAVDADVIAMLDGDGTYPANEFPGLLEARKAQGVEQIIGARENEAGTRLALRALIKRIVVGFASWLTGTKIIDLNSGMRVATRSSLVRIAHLIPNGFSNSTTMTIAAIQNGSVAFHPIQYFPRKSGSSKFRVVRDTAGLVLTLVRIVLYFAPLRVLGLPGLTLLSFALGKAIVDFMRFDAHIAISTVLIALAGFQTLFLALLADLISRTVQRPSNEQ